MSAMWMRMWMRMWMWGHGPACLWMWMWMWMCVCVCMCRRSKQDEQGGADVLFGCAPYQPHARARPSAEEPLEIKVVDRAPEGGKGGFMAEEG